MIKFDALKIRILYSAAEDYPPRRADVVVLFFEELANRGITCDWYLRNWRKQQPTSDTYLGQKIKVAPAVAIGGGVGKVINRVAYWLGDISFLTKGIKTADIAQVRDKYFAGLLALLVARIAGKKVVYWCSYPFPEHAIETADINGNILKAALRRAYGQVSFLWLYRFLMPRMDHVFVQSDQMLETLSRYGVPREKMTAVPMGVSRSLLDEAHPARGVPVVRNRIVYLGSLGRARRLEMLIEAFLLVAARIPDASLVMVGDGDVPSDRVSLQNYVRRIGLETRVEFTGQLPTDAAWLRVGEAAVCVSPIFPSATLRQGSPTKLFEYMALGKPIVANDHPEQLSVLAESAAGLCVPWNAEAFSDAICELLNDQVRAFEMAARGPGWVAVNRTYDRLADMVYAKYMEIVPSVGKTGDRPKS